MTFYGGVPECYSYAVRAAETDRQVRLSVVETRTAGDKPCIDLAMEITKTVPLDAPLGLRQVVDAEERHRRARPDPPVTEPSAGQWNESPQAQEPPAFGLSMVKPCFSMVSTKSIVAPRQVRGAHPVDDDAHAAEVGDDVTVEGALVEEELVAQAASSRRAGRRRAGRGRRGLPARAGS